MAERPPLTASADAKNNDPSHPIPILFPICKGAGRMARALVHFKKRSGSFRCRVLVAEQAVGRLVLLDFWEAADWGIEAIVRIVVVALTDLAQ